MASSESVSPSSGSVCVPELRLVLLGHTGSGRSSTGNTILGRSAFPTSVSPLSVTRRSECACATLEGRSVQVIDTPGFFNTCLSPEEVCEEVARCLALSAPGPHAILLVLQAGRVTEERHASLRWLTALFGPAALRHTVLVLTWADLLGGRPAESFLWESEELWELCCRYEGGFHALDNVAGGAEQVGELLQKVDALVQRNGGDCYTLEKFQHAQRALCPPPRAILGEEGVRLAEGSGPEEEEEARKKAEREFWSELVLAMGKGALEGSGVMEKGKGKGKKSKVVQRAAALASTPLSITSAAKVVGGAMREGSKVLYKHRKTLLQ